MADETPVGRRVAYWRKRRSMSQQLFADRLGKSKSWLDKVERGVRRLDKFSVLQEIADSLRIDVALLLPEGQAPQPVGPTTLIDLGDLDAVQAALERYEQVGLCPAPAPPPLADVRKSVRHAWLTFQHGRYPVLVRAVPKLLRDTQAVELAYRVPAERITETAHLHGQAYLVASTVLRKLGHHRLAWIAADRAMVIAGRAGDKLLTGLAAGHAGQALLGLDRPRSALEITTLAATALAPGGAIYPEHISVYGHLLLQAALAAATIGDSASVYGLLGSAGEAAADLADDANHLWTAFGPTNLALHQAAAAVQLGDGERAIRIHQKIDPDLLTALPAERRANHQLTLAHAYAQIGAVDRAGDALLLGDRLAKAEIRCRPMAHAVITDVLRGTRGTPSAPVAALAEQMGVGI